MGKGGGISICSRFSDSCLGPRCRFPWRAWQILFTRNLGKSLLIDMGPEKDKTLLLVLLVTLPAGGACCPMEKREKKED